MELLVSDATRTSESRWLFLHAVAVFAFLYLPIAVLIVYSFNGEGVWRFSPASSRLSIGIERCFADGPDLGFGDQ